MGILQKQEKPGYSNYIVVPTRVFYIKADKIIIKITPSLLHKQPFSDSTSKARSLPWCNIIGCNLSQRYEGDDRDDAHVDKPSRQDPSMGVARARPVWSSFDAICSAVGGSGDSGAAGKLLVDEVNVSPDLLKA